MRNEIMILQAGQKDAAMVELPPLSLNSMTKPQLEEFIPRLINLSCSLTSQAVSPTPSSASCYKPEWWPVDVPWITPQLDDSEELCQKFTGRDVESTDKLRSVVKACYEYMGHKDLLTKQNTNMDASLDCLKANTDVIPADSSDDDSDPEVVDVYVCFYCDHWFGGKEGKAKLEEHVLTHMNTTQNTVLPPSDPSGSQMNSITPDSQSSLLRAFLLEPEPEPEPKPNLEPKPKLEPKPSTPIPKRRKRPPEIPLWKRPDLPSSIGVSENEFLKSFGLISSKQAKTDTSKSRLEIDIDCEIIAVEGLDSRPLTSPRTPRSLMSQLSRDGEGSSRKRLSFSVPDDASDGETPDTSPDKSIQGALLNVPFSSLLGKRVKKHIKPDSSACTIKEPEEFCSTVHLRNEFLDKLRYRANDYPVTYKKKRKTHAKFTHEYKFNEEQRDEFLKKVRTGLNKESRRLKRRMIKCKVVMKRLSKEEIDFWKEKKKSHGAEWIDDDISIVSIEPAPVPVDRSRLYHAHTSSVIRPMRPNPMPIQTSHVPSVLQAKYPYLMQNITASQPQQCSPQTVPQFLVKKVEKQFNGHQSSKLVYVPISELQNGPPRRIEPRWNPHQNSQQSPAVKTWGEHSMVVDRRKLVQTTASRRKQHFVNVRRELDHDSDISINSESSDEDRASGRVTSSSTSVGKDPNMVPVVPQGHMVMSATGESVRTVSQKARKSFGKSTSLVNAQLLRHFTSHPNQKSDSSSRFSVPSRSSSSVASSPSVEPLKQQVESLRTGHGGQYGVHTVAPVHKPSTVLPQRPVLRVVDDVIYIDDDD